MLPVSVSQSVSEMAEWQKWHTVCTQWWSLSPNLHLQSCSGSPYPEFTQTWTPASYVWSAVLKSSLYVQQLLPLAQLGLQTYVIFSYLTYVLFTSLWPDAFHIQFWLLTVLNFRSSLFWGFAQRRNVVSEQPIGPFFKGQAGTDRLSRKVPKERRSHFHCGRSMALHSYCYK
jgi:hypothetical protein